MGIFDYNFDDHMQMIREESYDQGQLDKLSQNIKSLIETMGLSADEAMAALKITDSDREAVKPLL